MPLRTKDILKNKTAFLSIFIGVIFILFPASVHAESLTLDTLEDWESGILEDIVIPGEGSGIEASADGDWGALTWKASDKSLSVGSAFTNDGTNIYVARGYGDSDFWKLDTSTGDWYDLANLPGGAYYGSELEYLDGDVYAFLGGYQKTFAKYSVASDSWEVLEEFPEMTYYGSSLVTDGTDIYAVSANNRQGFFRFDVSEGEWKSLAGTPTNFRQGADLIYDNGFIYSPRGANTRYFYRYEIATNTWTRMTDAPGNFYDDVDYTIYNGEIYIPRFYNTTTFYKYTIATDTWTTLANAPMTSRYSGVQYMESDGYVYFFRGNGDFRYWKYDINNDEFIGPANAPANLNTGSDMIYYNGVIYTPRGANQAILYGYDVATNTWSTLAAPPQRFNDDVRGVLAGTHIYWFRGSNTTNFMRYTPSTDTWAEMAVAPATIRYGGALAYPGSGDYIYASRGNHTNTFYRYTISTDTWEAMTALPAGSRMAYGSTLLSDGTDIYATTGAGTSRMYKYDVAGDSWTKLSNVPFASHYGTDTTYHDGKIVALAGNYKTEAWEYTIATDTWRELPDFIGYRQLEYGPWTGASIEYGENGSYYMTRGGNTNEMLVYTPGTGDYVNNGVWTSPTYDLKYVSSWNSVVVEDDTPGDSYYTLQTRTSADSAVWSDWEATSGGNIVSPLNQFIQFKVTVFSSSTHDSTANVESITIDYTSDEIDPLQPTNIVGQSQEVGGEEITSGESYSHTTPSFTWDASVDNETSIVGYYVYFGNNPLGDPLTNGTFVTNAKYTVSKSLSVGSNYLRIIAEDLLGNQSEILDAFDYVYGGVGPVISVVADSSSFNGDLTSVQNTGTSLKLADDEGGFWLENRRAISPAGFYYGAKNLAYVESSNKVYVPRGTGTPFYEYDLNTDTWTTLSPAPNNIYYGGGAVEGPDGYVYVMRGYNSSEFWKYDIENDLWDTDIASAPLTVGYGGTTVFDGEQYIYALRGNNSAVFWRYDTFEDSWETLSQADFGAPSDAINNNVYVGGSLGFDRERGLIYANQGGYRHGFAVYEIDTDTWTVLPPVPALAYHGGSIEYYPETNSVYYNNGNYSNDLYKYDVDTQEWTELNSAPYGIYYGGGLHLINDILFTLRGTNNRFIYEYDIQKDSWKTPQRGLFGKEVLGSTVLNAYYGADFIKGDGDNYYITRGNYSDYFVRWNEKTGVITHMATAPTGFYYGSSMVYDSTNNGIYLTGGIYDSGFYYYDIDTNTWTELVDDPTPYTSGYGSSMDYDGSRYIYWNRGNNNNYFYQYDTQEVAGSRWTRLTNAPAGLGYGADLLVKDGFIYTPRGQNVNPNPLYKYNISLDTWDTSLSRYPDRIYNDGFTVDGGDGYLYTTRGGNTSIFNKYELATDTWSPAPDFPGQIYAGGAGASNGVNAMYAISGNGSSTYQDAIYTYIMDTENSSFVQEGEYVSQSHDLTSVYKWADLTVEYDTPNNTNLIIETSTSDDESEWTEWASVSREKEEGDVYKYKITSPTNRYIRVRFTFYSGDGILSPSVVDYTINYYQDLVAPDNPSTAGLTSLGSIDPEESISTDTWYNYSEPTFEWPQDGEVLGATDGSNGSGIAGYYVYWGTDSEADPETEGSLQEEIIYSPTDLEDAQTYYLRVKTLDNADNVSEDTWEPFIYKYDSSGPDSPADLTADPAGFTAIDNFSFSWNGVVTEGAQITGYCYKTGTEEGQFSDDQCIVGTSIENIPSYRIGANTFYVRSRDEAGNYSEYATVNYFYVDAANAPAPPTNVQVQPVTNTENSFGFTWDPPLEGTYYGSQSNLSYLYSVNALPTEFSTSATSLRYLNPGAYATLPGENILYLVTKDEAGNVDYTNYTQVSFFANTIAPGIPINIEIADVSVKSTESWRLAISWDEPEDPGSGVGGYQIYRSVNGEDYYFHTYTSGSSLVDTKLLQVMYYYQVRACDSTNNCGAFSETVNFLPDGRYTEPAELIVEPIISNITPKKATVSWVTARTADSKVAYGLEPGVYFEEEVSNSDHMVDHVLTINNLSPGTTYYYVTKWTDEDGNTGISEESTFETAPPPSIEEPIVKHVGLNSALIEFTTRDTSKVRIFYGETSSFGGMKEVYTGTAEGTHNVEIADIKDGTKYYYKINTFDIDGSEYEGEIHSFETLPRPRISDVSIYQVSGTSTSTLLIEWESNTAISSLITYYPVGQPEQAIDEVNVTLKAGKHRMILINLEANTNYSIIVSGRDFMGNEATSGVQNFQTATDTRPPQIYDLEVTSEIIGAGAEATAQLVVSYNTDEPSTSQVEYGEGTGATYSQKTQEDSSLATHHIVIVSGLTPSKVYHLRSISKDLEGNEGLSVDKVVVTSNATENALDLAINNLTSIFSFLGN